MVGWYLLTANPSPQTIHEWHSRMVEANSTQPDPSPVVLCLRMNIQALSTSVEWCLDDPFKSTPWSFDVDSTEAEQVVVQQMQQLEGEGGTQWIDMELDAVETLGKRLQHIVPSHWKALHRSANGLIREPTDLNTHLGGETKDALWSLLMAATTTSLYLASEVREQLLRLFHRKVWERRSQTKRNRFSPRSQQVTVWTRRCIRRRFNTSNGLELFYFYFTNFHDLRFLLLLLCRRRRRRP